MKYKVTNIKYNIEPEDVSDEADEFFGIEEDEEIEDHYIFQNNYDKKCEEIIDGIFEKLPSEMIVEIDDDTDADDVDDVISDVISDKTGWLIESFNFEPVTESSEPQE